MYDTLIGNNIILRKANINDLEDIFKVWNNINISDKMLWKVSQTIEEARDRLNRTINYQKENSAYFIALKESNMAIGFAGIKEEENKLFCESGIAINEDYQARGYGKEVLDLLLDLAFNKLSANRFMYTCFNTNENSKKVCLSRNFKYLDSINKIREHDNKKIIVDRYYLDKDDYKK